MRRMRLSEYLYVCSCLLLSLVCAVSALAQSTTTLTPVADSYVQYGSQTSNFGTAQTIIVKNAGATGSTTRFGFLKFDLSSISGVVASSTLKLYGSTANTSPD